MPSSVLSAPMASIGVPKEIKPDELRVALTPDGAKELVNQGLEVLVQSSAGAGAGIGDEAFAKAGAKSKLWRPISSPKALILVRVFVNAPIRNVELMCFL